MMLGQQALCRPILNCALNRPEQSALQLRDAVPAARAALTLRELFYSGERRASLLEQALRCAQANQRRAWDEFHVLSGVESGQPCTERHLRRCQNAEESPLCLRAPLPRTPSSRGACSWGPREGIPRGPESSARSSTRRAARRSPDRWQVGGPRLAGRILNHDGLGRNKHHACVLSEQRGAAGTAFAATCPRLSAALL